MKKRILVLEDESERRQAMRRWLDERLHMYELLLTDDPHEMVGFIRESHRAVLAVSLDHDLHERPDQSTELTGMLVVDHLVGVRPEFPVLLHTSNQHDGERMRSRLTDRGWTVDWVVPFNGTSWIATEWYHALKRAIRRTARRDDTPAKDDKDDAD